MKIMTCKYFVKGDKELKKADVIANNETEATAKLSAHHGKKGCAFIVDFTEHTATYFMPDEVFFANATCTMRDGVAIATE